LDRDKKDRGNETSLVNIESPSIERFQKKSSDDEGWLLGLAEEVLSASLTLMFRMHYFDTYVIYFLYAHKTLICLGVGMASLSEKLSGLSTAKNSGNKKRPQAFYT
jgi:O-methyltransferase involved in polyketide biosynthesis